MPNFGSVHTSFCADGNNSNSSSYHLLHGQLEWRWIYLTIIYKIEYAKGLLGSDDSDFRAELILFIYDLLSLSIAKFHKCNNATIIFSSPFICSCVKVMWSVLHQFCLKLQDDSIKFWNIFSSILNNLRNHKNPHEEFPSKKVLLRSSAFVTCKNLDQFSIWLVCGLVKLLPNDVVCNRESYEVFENIIKNYLSVEQSEENLRILLLMISEVIFDVWTPRPEILMNLWESFQRKINSPFFIAGQTPNMMAVSSVSGAGYLEKIRTQQATTTKLNPNWTSYDMFVFLLGKMVQRFTDESQKIQVQKILGRIYTKFPAAKLQTINEMGIHNILKLFITLSVSTNFHEIAKKVSDTLLQIPMEKMNHQQQLMKGYMAILILYHDNQMNITQYATKLMTQVNILTEKSSNGVNSVLKIMADALPVIFSRHSDDETFENGEEILLDSWIVKYLSGGSLSEQDRVFDSLTKIICKIREIQSKPFATANPAIAQKLFNILLPHCKQVFGKSESMWLPSMVGHLCLLASDFQHQNVRDIPKFDVIFKTFIDLNCLNIENSIKFLTVVLENSEKIKQLDKLTIIQNWIKFSVLMNGNNSNLKELTRCMIKIDEFSSLCEMARSKPEEFLNTKEPLCTFVTEISKIYAAANNQVKFQLIEKVHGYFVTFEKWAMPLVQLQQAAKKPSTTTDEFVMRIYTMIAVIIMHISELIYNRSKSSCFFNVAISQFILPQPVMMGQTVPRPIFVSVHRVWPLLIEGISRLDYKNDQHVNKVLSDVIVKWVPLFKITNNSKFVAKPFITVANMTNSNLVEFFYAKLGKSFIALQARKPSPHACMILTMIEEIMHVVEGDEKKVLMLWKSVMAHVIEAAMLSEENIPSQITCINLLQRFVKNKNFELSQAMKQLVVSSLQSATQNQLSYYSVCVFR